MCDTMVDKHICDVITSPLGNQDTACLEGSPDITASGTSVTGAASQHIDLANSGYKVDMRENTLRRASRSALTSHGLGDPAGGDVLL